MDPFCTGCPQFNTSREPSSRSAFTPSTRSSTRLTESQFVHTDTKTFATNFMTDFKADIESKAQSSTVRFSSLSFSTDVTDAAPLGDDLASTIAQTNAIEYKGGWTNTEQAIARCDQTLSSVGFNSLRYILLFTDGTPTTWGDPRVSPSTSCATFAAPNCRTQATAAANIAKGKGIEVITIAVSDGSTDIPYLFSLNSTNLGFAVESFKEAELVTDAILDQIDIPCPPTS